MLQAQVSQAWPDPRVDGESGKLRIPNLWHTFMAWVGLAKARKLTSRGLLAPWPAHELFTAVDVDEI